MYIKYNDESERFWCKVCVKTDSECWNWLRNISNRGYGLFGFKGKMVGSHRVAYELTYGEIPDGMMVLHSCNNKLCCNPKHLKIGTQKENLEQMKEEGRSNKAHKLEENEVIKIRQLHKSGIKQTKLSEIFNISYSQIGNIVHNRFWKDIK